MHQHASCFGSARYFTRQVPTVWREWQLCFHGPIHKQVLSYLTGIVAEKLFPLQIENELTGGLICFDH